MKVKNVTSFLLAAQPKLVTGTVSMLQTLTAGLTLIFGVSTVCIGLYSLFQLQSADEHEAPAAQKKLKRTIIIGVIATCFAGLVTFVLSFYK